MTVQRVEPGALTGQATEMKGRNWHKPAEDAVTPPDGLPATADAIANLNDNARSLKEFQRWAEVEYRRIAEMLEIAAQAYQKVDDDYGTAIDDPERAAAVEAIVIPEPPTTPPEIPSPAGTPRLLDASGYSNVAQTQAELSAPDTGASLKFAMMQWAATSKRVASNKPKPPPGDWEGEAADAAYARMNTFGGWLTQLSEAWHDLAEAAAKIVAAHDKAKTAHDPLYQEYTALESRMRALAEHLTVGGGLAVHTEMDSIRKRMEELQAQSDEVRRDYADSATFAPVRPADPPATTADGPTATSAGARGGDQPTGDSRAASKAMAQQMGESTAGPQSATGADQGDGRSPSGGGSPADGGASGGSPDATGASSGSSGGARQSPTDPTLRPVAASGGGGSGGGSGGGTGSGGAGSAPLSPAVTAETVAPGPPVPVAAATPGATTPSGVGGTAMGGGMAPVHGAQGAQQGKEKRRDPLLAPDEDLYTEDRPWTESVIGNRRRRDVADGRETGGETGKEDT